MPEKIVPKSLKMSSELRDVIQRMANGETRNFSQQTIHLVKLAMWFLAQEDMRESVESARTWMRKNPDDRTLIEMFEPDCLITHKTREKIAVKKK